MYVVTFYSFKGGVGRTLALVNVAVALAQTGRKVLLVDFDLEAPGVHTFEALKPQKPHPGVVEYVSDFASTRSSPDVRDYIYEAIAIGQRGGRLWVMPAGRGDAAYRRHLASINWRELYKDSDGYLMIEDLKAQWKSLHPDYVLLDSRTGHVDVGGICTRQLPDAVVVLFFPNEQNLAGLTEVVRDISSEVDRSRPHGSPVLHYVMSNVPDLDDEEEILKSRIRQFRAAFGHAHFLMIHNYQSLSLLNQTIFTRDRPKSRLTKEYHVLMESIVEENMEDREAAVNFLRRSLRGFGLRTRRFGLRAEISKQEVEDRLRVIRESHPHDGELLFLVGMLRKNEGRFDEARELLDQAVERGYRHPAVLLERATTRLQADNKADIAGDLLEALQSSSIPDFEVERAIRMLGSVNEETLLSVPETPAFRSLDFAERMLALEAMMRHRTGLLAAARVLREALKDFNLPIKRAEHARNNLVLCLIGTARFEEAMRAICSGTPVPRQLSIEEAFNYAMAEWGKTADLPRKLFAYVAELDQDPENRRPTANYAQCLAVTYWALGDLENATRAINEAEKRMAPSHQPEFSCWRYRYTSRKDFLEDCESVRRLIKGESTRPLFFPQVHHEFAEQAEKG